MNKYEIAAAVEIAGIANTKVKLTPTQQREMFGAVLFGKQNVRFDLSDQGKVEVSRKATGPTNDTLFNQFTLDEVASAIAAGRELRA